MRRLLVLAALCFAVPAHAVTIDWVTVGDPGNSPDTELMTCCLDSTGTTGYGSVGYVYRIGKYEVTNTQYAEFLNAVAKNDTYGLYDTGGTRQRERTTAFLAAERPRTIPTASSQASRTNQ